ncbi:hypothetical protein E6C70_09695 [Glaciibacter flavus]|uniref:Uncharacterized protein n=1 Tax=Orlajensenia flava TaxID=2565934 RepID=A0A4S4FVY6_9MICO|nr:hypothetical protein [Glaciibacter flavus]THG34518.1 hypothetical protein E6C70_09695 [Glaciibacter flavus]
MSPLLAPAVFGLFFFVLSWMYPRRIVSLPDSGPRVSFLVRVGIAGSLVVAFIGCAVNATTPADMTGFEGWWRRPAALFTAALVVAVSAIILRFELRPTAAPAVIAPRRPWNTFTSRPLVWVSGIIASLLALTAVWQTVIATTAPEDGQFLGNVPAYSPLPIYMMFNGQFGYIAGVGWPNNLATLAALGFAVLVLVMTLRADANRPLPDRGFSTAARSAREMTARLFALLILGGLIVTLGAVWMHAGEIGQMKIAINDDYVSKDHLVTFGGSYDMIAFPLNYGGRLVQGLGVALLLRIAVDTGRAAARRRQQPTTPPTATDDLFAGLER